MPTALQLLLLLIPYGGCAGGGDITTETVALGQNVSLACPRDNKTRYSLVWTRLVSGTFPEFLFEAPSINSEYINHGSLNGGDRITARQEPGKFVLRIRQVQKSDMAVYYCFKVLEEEVIALRGTVLHVTGNDINLTTATEDSRSDAVRPVAPVTFRCSVLSSSGNKTCTDGHNVYWFTAGTRAEHPSFVYAREDCGEVEGGSAQKCVHGFSKDAGTSEAGTYSCAVATCGRIFMPTAKKVIIEDPDVSRCESHGLVISVLGAAWALSLVLLAFLVKKSMTERCFCRRANPQSQEEPSGPVQQCDEDSLMYTLPTIIAAKSAKTRRTNARPSEELSAYAEVRFRN
ncbi:uncharacterized protein LOC133508796 [Syngnathoides biaculeatus]|uniref:uncharacterized protein LOC133508796 n=1 Tax=Syngnathoides biaculeatus TaxID=300417 RepID=UPI002ADE1FE3|nr:uncharacterized protein LOC133508796 [Syngnathoides biaculeatus]